MKFNKQILLLVIFITFCLVQQSQCVKRVQKNSQKKNTPESSQGPLNNQAEKELSASLDVLEENPKRVDNVVSKSEDQVVKKHIKKIEDKIHQKALLKDIQRKNIAQEKEIEEIEEVLHKKENNNDKLQEIMKIKEEEIESDEERPEPEAEKIISTKEYFEKENQLNMEKNAQEIQKDVKNEDEQQIEEINKKITQNQKEEKLMNKVDQALNLIDGDDKIKQIPAVKIPASSSLPTTPKGLSLENHFGQDPKQSNYGPQPTLLKQEAWIESASGKKEKTIITKIIHTSKDQSGCDLSSFANFQVCLEFSDCDICSAAPQCGWCEATQRCLPGDLKSASCPKACSNKSWNFATTTCTNKVKSGYLKMSHDASKLIHPELTQPKVKLATTLSHQAVVRTPVLLGTKKYKTQTIKVDNEGKVVGKSEVDVVKPIVGEVHQVMNVNTQHQQYIDIKSGKRLDKPEVDSYHGKDEY